MGALRQVGVSCVGARRGTFHVAHSEHTSGSEEQGNGSEVWGVDEKLKRDLVISCTVEDELI